jgi:hypothetical protein
MESKKVKWWILFESIKMESIRKLSLKKTMGEMKCWKDYLDETYGYSTYLQNWERFKMKHKSW